MTEKKQKTCFVIMPFADERRIVFDKAIKPACVAAGFEPVRTDELEDGPFNITQEIIEQIFRCDAIIADMTDWRPNVFYEMGVAHAIDNKTIMMIQKKDPVPFDVHAYNCLFYEQSTEGLKEVQKRLQRFLSRIEVWRNNPKRPTNPVQQFKPYNAFVPLGDWQRLQKTVQEQEARLRKMVPATELQAVQQALRQKEEALAGLRRNLKASDKQLVEKDELLAKLERELQQLRQHKLVSLSARAKLGPENTLHLRSQPIEKLETEAVKQMLRERNFFARDWHKDGKGIAHQYERRVDGQVVYDGATGLSWQQAGSDKSMNFEDAQAYVKKVNDDKFAGRSDWRLPTLEEAMSLMAPKKHDDLYIDPVFDKTQRWIWTADTAPAGGVWVVDFDAGSCYGNYVYDDLYVRAVF